jgi:hypothetical protein
MKKVLFLILLLISFLITSTGIMFIAYLIKGDNYSDAGIAMYSNGEKAYITGILLYCGISTLLLITIKVKLEKKVNALFITGLIFVIVYFFIYQWIVAWLVNSGIYIPLF